MSHFLWFAHVSPPAPCTRLTIRTLAAIATGSMLLLGASPPARASDLDLFLSECAVCHNNSGVPGGFVFNAAGNAALIQTVNALGMGASGSPADHMSIAAYLDSIKPTITLAPVAHDSPKVIPLLDIRVNDDSNHLFLKVIQSIQTVTPPTKGVVEYTWANGPGNPSTVTYTPFTGQSGTDTWTYQGIGARGNTTIRTASVSIAAGSTASFAPIPGVWWNPSEPGSGLGLDYKDGTLVAEVYSYLAGGPAQWYLAAGPLTNNVFTATLDKYRGGQCISCAYANPGPAVGNDGTITITFTSPTTGTAELPGGRHIPIQRYFPSAPPAGAFIPVPGVWWNKDEPGSGFGLDYQPGSGAGLDRQNSTLIAEVYSYLPGGASQWYLAAGPLTNNVFTATLDKYVNGQCISCAYMAPGLSGNDGTITITFTSQTTATVDLPGGRHIQVQRYFQP